MLTSWTARESLFKPDTRSAAGAVGLMQLLPATARRAAIVLGRPTPSDADMAEPRTAIDLGAWYLSELLGRFGDPAIAAAAYNAGPRVAAPWAMRGAGQPLDQSPAHRFAHDFKRCWICDDASKTLVHGR